MKIEVYDENGEYIVVYKVTFYVGLKEYGGREDERRI